MPLKNLETQKEMYSGQKQVPTDVMKSRMEEPKISGTRPNLIVVQLAVIAAQYEHSECAWIKVMYLGQVCDLVEMIMTYTW